MSYSSDSCSSDSSCSSCESDSSSFSSESDSSSSSCESDSSSSGSSSCEIPSEKPTRVVLFEYKQNDPKRDTGMKLVRLGLARSLRPGDAFKGIVLSAEGQCVLSPLDRALVSAVGIACVNCSWNRLDEVKNVPGGNISRHRKLPLLIAANPINYGKAFKLSSAEALAGGLGILGLEAKKLTEKFSWHDEFWKLNSDLIEAYAKCGSREEVLAIQQQWMGPEDIAEPRIEKIEKIASNSSKIEKVEPPKVEELIPFAWSTDPPKDMRKCLLLIRDWLGKPHASGNALAKTKRKEYCQIWSDFIASTPDEKYELLFQKEFK